MRLPRKFATSDEHAHPLVRQFYRLMGEQLTTPLDVAERSGVPVSTMSCWRNRTNPQLPKFDAVLNVLGYRLAIVPICDKDKATVPVTHITHILRRREYCATPVVRQNRTLAP